MTVFHSQDGDSVPFPWRSTFGTEPFKSRVLAVMSTLLVALPIAVQTQKVKPLLTTRPSFLFLNSEDGTSGTKVRIGCSISSNKIANEDLKKISIRHRHEGASNEGEIMIEATDTNRNAELKGNASRSSEYKASGTLVSVVILVINKADCEDAGKYTCTMTYDIYDRRGSKRTVESSTHAYIEVEPYAINVSRSPDKPIVVGDLLVLKCTGVVGTLINDGLEKKSKLVWVYRNRESAIENKYLELDPDLQNKVVYGQSQKVRCSERQEVNLTLTVDENRDSLRDYFCVGARYREGLQVEFRPGGRDTNISMPSFEKVDSSEIGNDAGGYVGIAVAALALSSGAVFGAFWFCRRTRKNTRRNKKIERRQSKIEKRRESVSKIMESRSRSMSELARSASMTGHSVDPSYSQSYSHSSYAGGSVMTGPDGASYRVAYY